MQKDAFWSLLEQIRAWNECHMLGAMRMDEIEDLKMMIPTWARFPSWSRKAPMEDGILAKLGILVEMGFLVELGNLEDWSSLLEQGFLLGVGNVNPKWHQVAATRKISKSKKEKVSKMNKEKNSKSWKEKDKFPNARRTPKHWRIQRRRF